MDAHELSEIPESSQVVRIFAAVQEHDYEVPWQTNLPSSGTGSGVVIGKDRVLTGAHVVANATFVQVQTVHDSDKHVATVEAVCHDSDLALLKLTEPGALKGIPVAEMGELPERRARVAVVGFPVGGEELSITEGVVSRIEVQRYAHSHRHLLALTVDAAINSGNSGGPVLHEGRVVGIAFQSLEDAENIGEAVPMPLIRRFLEAVETGRPLEVPMFGMRLQNLENPGLRRHLGVPQGESGMLVSSVEFGGSACGVVQPGDVVHEIDGHKLANNGTVRYRGRVRTRVSVLLGERFLGDRVAVVLRREGKRFEAGLELQRTDHLVPRSRYGVTPTYFVFAGIVFQPLTLDFLETWRKWDEKAPKEFVANFYMGQRTEQRQEVIVISQILADDLTVGYGPNYWESITRVNGQVPRDMRHLVELVEKAEKTIRFDTSTEGQLVFDADEARDASKRILERYRIPADRSPDLITQPE